MQVQVGTGAIYSLQNLDNSAYGSMPADTTANDQIVKQGLLKAPVLLNCPAPSTVGNSINYLIEAAYQDSDGGATVLPYFNVTPPNQPFAGPNNTGVSQNTVRQGLCQVQVKAGVSAPTGTQTTPAVDTGFTALYVVTVAQSTTSIAAGNIVQVAGAPFIQTKIGPGLIAAQTSVVGSTRNAKMSVPSASATATFTADEIVVAPALGGVAWKIGNFNQTVNLATTGAGGMDTGTAPVLGYVGLYAIYNPSSGAAALLAVNATSAVVPQVYGGTHMPGGYTASALVSVWPTNASGQFVVGFQVDRVVEIAAITPLSTSTPTAGPTSLSITSAVPPNARNIHGTIGLGYTAAGTNTTIVLVATGSTSLLGQQGLSMNGLSGTTPSQSIPFRAHPVSSPQTIFYNYSVTTGSAIASINVVAYEF
jgi:hypothetical protein